jgi:Fe-S oxidoreductase
VLAFADDRGSFATATRRCLGVGKCVTASGGVMCPSFRATGEEQHSTRGRARLLFEMANGQVITDGWRSPEVEEALDLCLSCKGCKRDCPVGVDMASYKTEYLAQRYKRRLRPVSHYSMGALPAWLYLVGLLPPRAVDALNAAGRGVLGRVAKRLGGVAPERAIPALARDRSGARPPRALRSRHDHQLGAGGGQIRPDLHPAGDQERRRVLLWTDTFSSSFDPAVVRSAVAVLTALGYAVELPPRTVCCGLTWTTTGQVGTARRVLGRSLNVIKPWLDEGVPVVGLEPSCTAALRADAAELLPGHPLVPLLEAGVRTFAELLAEHGDELRAAVVAPAGRALVQVHCHQHAELGADADRAVLAALGADAEVLDSGCCGLAGNFGFEKGHYEVSMACAERVLLPAVRAADPDVTVLADGFSCRTQLRQADTREPLHLAQLAARALGLQEAL